MQCWAVGKEDLLLVCVVLVVAHGKWVIADSLLLVNMGMLKVSKRKKTRTIAKKERGSPLKVNFSPGHQLST